VGERWNEKLARWRAFLVAKAQASPPIKVEPKRRRWSDPRITPSDWYTDEGQRRLTPLCALCREPQLAGSPPLRRGLCGPCWTRTSETDDAA
jgi:hypothetical protein